MEEKEIIELFRILKLTKKILPEYKDPYTFAEGIEKCSILKLDKFTYSAGTGSVKEEKNA